MDRFMNYLANDDKHVGFTKVKACLNLLGVSWWWKKSLLKTLHRPMALIILFIFVFGAVHFTITIDLETSNDLLDMFLSVIFIQTTSWVGIKIFLMHCYANKCKDAIKSAENLQIKRGIKSNTGLTRKILTFYMGNIAVTVVGCLIYGTYKHGFPSRVSYPFIDVEMKTAPVNHCIMWVLQAFTCFYAGAGNAGPDGAMMLIISIIVNFGNRLKELLNKIGKNPNEDHFIIREAVEMHVIIIELTDKVVKAFRFVLLCQLIFTITHTCIIVFAVTKVDDLGLIMTSLMPILIAAYFQLFVFSYAGEILLNMSEDLTFSAYDNQWYNTSIENRKHLILLVEASKRTLSFESYGIIRACYETCLNCIRESFSYYVVLKTIESAISGQ